MIRNKNPREGETLIFRVAPFKYSKFLVFNRRFQSIQRNGDDMAQSQEKIKLTENSRRSPDFGPHQQRLHINCLKYAKGTERKYKELKKMTRIMSEQIKNIKRDK